MYPVTDAFNSGIIAKSRQTKGLIEFEILDIDANNDATATVTSEEDFSKKSQLYNQVRFMSGKYATLETDYWHLDGTFGLVPQASETEFEVGWWSDLLSGQNGVFSTPQQITTQFTQDQSSIGISITFDILANEYAKEFTVAIYDSLNNVIYTTNVLNNSLTTYILEQNLNNYRKVVVTITSWCKADRRARITEIDFGIIKIYDNDKLISMNILEEVDLTSNNITSNEIEFTIDNQDKAFNILNPTGIYPYLQRKQKIKPYLGLVVADSLIEYVPMGMYYLSEWKSDEGALTATFTARDMTDLLSDNKFPETSFSLKTLKFIIDTIMSDAAFTNYSVDSALDLVTVSGTIPELSHREALQVAAIAGQAIIYCDRQGVLQFKQIQSATSVFNIDYNNSYKSPQIKLEKLINTVKVKYGASTYTLTDPSKPAGEPVSSVIVDNPLISTLPLATSVANWLLAEYKKRYNYEINWRMNQALELGDTVTVQDDFSENKTMSITKNEFQYAGYLTGKTNGRG